MSGRPSPSNAHAPVASPGELPAEPKARILVVDDEASMRQWLQIALKKDGYDVLTAQSGREALELLRHPDRKVHLLLSDIRMPDMSGVDVLREVKAVDRDVIVFMMTAFASTDTAVEAMRLGALDYFTKPFNIDELRLKVSQHLEARRIRDENVLLKRALKTRHEFSSMIGRSGPMLEVFKMVETIAQTSSTVLVTGESGTGKDLVARAIHYNSTRRDQPFVALNCGAVPETLLESELFGHMRGAFTGADANKKGLIEAAERGTIFLDEIGEMNAAMQVKLLRVLQERRFRPLGGTAEVLADIRVIAATNQDLQKMVGEGRFREDLFYRIHVIPVQLPPLRDRREDIALLAEHFLEKYSALMDKQVRSISRESMALLEAYTWPGNVRELENVIERSVALEQTPAVLPETLPTYIRSGDAAPRSVGRATVPLPVTGALPDLGEGFDLEARGEDFYRHYIALALERAGGVQVKAAEMLGMSFRSFRYYAKKFNLR
ncbi:MAG: sigma-54 dependent transcriptional regulator [Vicinamibacterales bacterium]